MKNIVLLVLTLILFSCGEKESNKPSFKITTSQTEIDANFVSFITMGSTEDTTYNFDELIKKNNINSMIEYGFRNEGLIYDDIKRYPITTIYYNNQGEATKYTSNETQEETNIPKYDIDTTWEDNKQIFKTNRSEITNVYDVKNGVGTIKESIYQDSTINTYTRKFYPNKVVDFADEMLNETTTIWEWEKDNKGNIIKIVETEKSDNNITEQSTTKIYTITYKNNKVNKVTITNTNGKVTEKYYKWDGDKLIEISEYENNGEDWFSVNKTVYNSIGLVIKRLDYICDKSDYKRYLNGNKVEENMIETICYEYEYFTKEKPFDVIK